MAKLRNGTHLTGGVGPVSYYKRRDLEGFIVRTKGGPSKEKIDKLPSFEIVRKNNKEFGGRSRFTRFLLKKMAPLQPLFDYNLAGPLNALVKYAQLLDKEREMGQRAILLSQSPELMVGFPLNKRNVFESVVRSPLSITISRQELRATVQTPILQPGLNFFPVDNYPVFRWRFSLMVVSDLYYHEEQKLYRPLLPLLSASHHFEGDWCHSAQGADKTIVELSISPTPDDEKFSLLLVAGIGFGTIRAQGPEQVKYAGTGKIINAV